MINRVLVVLISFQLLLCYSQSLWAAHGLAIDGNLKYPADFARFNYVSDQAENADLLLRPPVAKFGLTDIKSFDKIVAAGYEHAREHVAKWQSADERAMPRSGA